MSTPLAQGGVVIAHGARGHRVKAGIQSSGVHASTAECPARRSSRAPARTMDWGRSPLMVNIGRAEILDPGMGMEGPRVLPRPRPCRRRVTLARWMSARETEWHPVGRGRRPHPSAAPRARRRGASDRSPQASGESWKHEESTAKPAPSVGGEGRRACDLGRSRARAAPRSPPTGEARNRIARARGRLSAPRDPPRSLDRAGTILALGGHPSAIHLQSQRAPVLSSRRPPAKDR